MVDVSEAAPPSAARLGAAQDRTSSPGLWRQRWLVICLTLLSMLAMIDRFVLTLFVGDIRKDLGLTDTEIGLAIGIAFGIANAVIGLPAGWFADKVSRRGIIAFAVALWSVFAAGCGLANNFLQLFIARVGVGVGEGIIPPASYSLIRDGVDPARRGRAFSAYAVAGSLGAGLSLLLGGALVGALVKSGVHELPVIGPVKPWQMALFIIGLVGMPLALLAYSFPDPGRGAAEDTRLATFSQTFSRMRSFGAAMSLLMGFSVASAIITGAISAWLPAFLGRAHGLTPQVVGPTLGILLMVSAPAGLLMAGQGMDRLSRREPQGPALVAIVASVILGITAVLVPTVASLKLMWVLQTLLVLTSTVYYPVTSTIVARLMPSEAIGKSMSLFLLIQGLCGYALAPPLVPLVAAHLYPGEPNGLGLALATVAAVFGVIAVVCAIGLFVSLRRLTPAQLPAG